MSGGVLRLQQINLHVRDLPGAKEFYESGLGLTVRFEADWSGNDALLGPSAMLGARLRACGFEIPQNESLLVAVEFDAIERRRAIPGIADPGSTQLALRVSDIDQVVERLERIGRRPLAAIAEYKRGTGPARVATVSDPDGHYIELAEEVGGPALDVPQDEHPRHLGEDGRIGPGGAPEPPAQGRR